MNFVIVLSMSIEDFRQLIDLFIEFDGVILDLIRKVIFIGVCGVLKSEENIWNIVGDIFNNEIFGNVIGIVGSILIVVCEEVVCVVGQEVVKYLDWMNFDEEIVKVFMFISLELKIEI